MCKNGKLIEMPFGLWARMVRCYGAV